MASKRKANNSLVAARASGKSVRESAEIAGISERTAYRRLSEAETAQDVARVGMELDLLTYRAILGLRSKALDALSRGLESPEEATRLKVARLVLDHADRLHERIALVPKLHRLEDQLAEVSLD